MTMLKLQSEFFECQHFIRPPLSYAPNVMLNQIAVPAMVTDCKNLQSVTKLTVGDDTFTVGDKTFYCW